MIHEDGVHANDLGHRPRWRDESVLKADYGF